MICQLLTFASILSWFTASADEAVVQVEALAKSRLSQLVLALVEWNHRQLNLLEDHLVLSFLAEHVFSPAAGEATGVIEVHILRWQADGVDVLFVLDGVLQEQQSDVVVETTFVVVFVDDQVLDIVIGVREKFVLGLSVPFTGTHLQCRRILALHAVSG